MNFIITVFLFIMVVSSSLYASPMTLQINNDADGQDAWVDENRPVVFVDGGNDDEIRVANPSTASNMRERTYIRFNLSSITSPITTAELGIYLYENHNEDNLSKNLTANRVTSLWSENNISWNTQPTFDTQYQAISTIPDDYIGWVKVDVTDMVNFWLNNPSQNYGFELEIQFSSQLNLKRFASSEQPENPYQHPVLLIDGGAPVPEPMSFLLLGMSLLPFVHKLFKY